MPTSDQIMMQKEKLYETAAIRNDLDDSQATKLLNWGETQIDRLASEFADTFTTQSETLQRMMRLINGFVGKRAEIDETTTQKYIDKISEILPTLGWNGLTSDVLFADLPEDKTDTANTLDTILTRLETSRMADPETGTTSTTDTVSDSGDLNSDAAVIATAGKLHEDVTDGIAPPKTTADNQSLDGIIYTDKTHPRIDEPVSDRDDTSSD